MKKLSLVMALLLSTSYAFSAGKTAKTTTNESKFDVRVPVKNWIRKMNDGFRVGIAKGSLELNSRARTRVSGSQGIDVSSNDTNSTNYQLHIGHERVRVKEVGHSAFLVYQDLIADGENVRNMRMAGNATYGLTNQAYVYGGLNYGKWYGSGLVEDIYDAGIGYQAGLGMKFHEKARLEVEYLTLQNEGSREGINYNVDAKGLMIKINTPFSFNI